MSPLKRVTAVLATTVVLIFVFQNTEVVLVRFLVWDLSMSRALMLIVVFALGFLSGWLSQLRLLSRRP